MPNLFSTHPSTYDPTVTVIDARGRLSLGEGAVVLRDTARDELAKGNTRLILNLRDVPYTDSSAIYEIVHAFTSASKRGGEVKLLDLTGKVHDLLTITKLYTVFDVYTSETDLSAYAGKGHRPHLGGEAAAATSFKPARSDQSLRQRSTDQPRVSG